MQLLLDEASQVLFDILASDGRVGHLVDKQVVKIYFSNPDLYVLVIYQSQ